jgi:hypothetical protein
MFGYIYWFTRKTLYEICSAKCLKSKFKCSILQKLSVKLIKECDL